MISKLLFSFLILAMGLSSCTISAEQASQLNTMVEVAGVLMSEEDAAKLEALQSLGSIVITVNDSK